MKNKKAIGIITAVGACALLVFSVVVFPFILAATPENRELETIERDSVYPGEETGHQNDSEQQEQRAETGQQDTEATTIDINAITEEMAIALVLNSISHDEHTDKSPNGETRTTSLELRGASYIESADHIDAPIWRVLFYERHFGESFVYIGECIGDDLESALNYRIGEFCCFTNSFGEDNDGKQVVVSKYSYEALNFIDVNAFTGELIAQGIVGMCDHEGTKREFSYDDATDWEMLKEKQDLYYYHLNDLRELTHPKSESDTADSMIRVPNLTGSTQTEVVAAFSKVDLVLEIHLFDGNFPAGTVMFISDAGKIVPAGTNIHIHVSTGSSSPHPTPEPSPRPIP